MKLLEFTQVKIDGEDAPKVSKLGKLAIPVDNIAGFYETFDKFDCKIPGVLIVRTKDGAGMPVEGNFNAFMEILREADL